MRTVFMTAMHWKLTMKFREIFCMRLCLLEQQKLRQKCRAKIYSRCLIIQFYAYPSVKCLIAHENLYTPKTLGVESSGEINFLVSVKNIIFLINIATVFLFIRGFITTISVQVLST